MELSKRLQTIANMVTKGNRVADVGCDHGFVPIYLYRQGISSKLYAMDVRTGPLERAREHIEAYGLSSYIETRLSDGVSALKAGEADTLICAGMGGRLMGRILTEGKDKILSMQELILQPQSEIAYFRSCLRSLGLMIVDEDMVKEEGKFYPIIRAVPSPSSDIRTVSGERQELEDAYGPVLLRKKHPVLREYLEVLQQRNENILTGLQTGNAAGRREELLCEQAGIANCLAAMKDERGHTYERY